jgi:predicted amidophosphoribosyltransferase
MTCSRCRKSFDEEEARCPHCGEPAPGSSGLFQTSTVLISSGGADLVYRSVDEVPARLRTRLLKSTNGGDSATILIADRRGRKQIAKAMGRLPGSAQRWLVQSILGAQPGTSPLGWLTPRRKNWIVAVVVLVALAVVALVFNHRWR